MSAVITVQKLAEAFLFHYTLKLLPIQDVISSSFQQNHLPPLFPFEITIGKFRQQTRNNQETKNVAPNHFLNV